MAEIESFELAALRKKWATSETAGNHDPAEALQIALDDIKAGRITPLHVLVVIGAEGSHDGAISCKYYSAGPFEYWATLGLLEHAKDEIKDQSAR